MAYDACLVATGSLPFVPGVPVVDLSGVDVLRNIADLGRVLDWLAGKTEVMVVDDGLLGLELAPDAGHALQRTLEARGMKFVTGTSITELLGSILLQRGARRRGSVLPSRVVGARGSSWVRW